VVEVVNFSAAKTRLSGLIKRAAAGEEIVIARAGKPVAKLGPLTAQPTPPPKPRQFGFWKGKIKIAEDFDDPLPKEILDLFYESPIEPSPTKPKRKR
jgi:prevent-host-death family protein